MLSSRPREGHVNVTRAESMSVTRAVGAFAMIALVGCSSTNNSPPAAQTPPDAGSDSGVSLCPDPKNPRVHYVSSDPAACRTTPLDCSTAQNGFDNACGCGCIDKGSPLCPPVDDPAITWVSRDPAQCGSALPDCPLGETAFNSTCGCGCVRPGG